jgi:hypothetical protein
VLQSRAVKVIGGAVAAAGLFVGGIAWAGGTPTVVMVGGSQVQTKVATNVSNWDTASQSVWENVIGASLTVSVPAGHARLVTARFNAETNCSAAGGEAWCAMRIMAKKPGSSPVQLHPRSGYDFAIDSPGGEAWEGNSITRSLRLGSGSWTIWVQGMSVGSGGGLGLDDWHYEVDVYTSS